MTEYEFTLVVDRMPTDEEIDALFETDEGNSIPEGGATGPALVHVFREASSRSDAIASAMVDVESVGLAVTGIQSDEVVDDG